MHHGLPGHSKKTTSIAAGGRVFKSVVKETAQVAFTLTGWTYATATRP
ncbi:MAG: hypothetical protein V4735_07735 [Pseudomonadota bacterium]